MFRSSNSASSPSARRGLRRLASTLLLLPVLAGLPPAVAAPDEAARPPLPAMNLGNRLRGEAAIQALGARLAQVAAHYRMTPERLADILRQDRTAWIDAGGRLLYIDEFPTPPRNDAAAAPAEALDLNQTFQLHSRPGAQRTIYLDFNGHVATNTAWSSGTIVAEPFDLDGNPASFNDAEKERIQFIWQRVAEDFAPFDVDVTTEEPPADALRRSSESDAVYGTRVVTTRNTFFNCFCGGVAFVGVFNTVNAENPDFFQPAWAFYDALFSDEKNIAEVISHEAGHNLGLSHDGTPTEEYYPGHGSGPTGWAPIMGVGYYQPLVQWSRGEYPNANNQQDDIAVMTSFGVPLRADDVGNSRSTASALEGAPGGSSFSVSQRGIIERETDVDFFSFVMDGGSVQFTIEPDPRSPNLDVFAELYTSGGTRLLRVNPANELDASISLPLPAGTYYLAVGGTGKGDLATGYSDYGSLGQYRISGSHPLSDLTPPVAVASATPTSGTAPLTVSFNGSGSSDPDGSIVQYRWDFGDGSSASTANPQHTYTAAGTFTATLRVTDDDGLSDSDAVTIEVAPSPTSLHVQGITMALNTRLNNRLFQCAANVTVRTGTGLPASGATVRGHWSGVTSETQTATTGSGGVATFRSPWTLKRGTCTFTADDITLSGFTYVPAQNEETSDSLSY